jgi:hypothetical protein
MSRTSTSQEEMRRKARAGWPVAMHSLQDDAGDDLSDTTDPAQRIRMMWPLAVEAWRLAGRPLPAYTRANTPCRVFRAGGPRPDDDDSR